MKLAKNENKKTTVSISGTRNNYAFAGQDLLGVINTVRVSQDYLIAPSVLNNATQMFQWTDKCPLRDISNGNAIAKATTLLTQEKLFAPYGTSENRRYTFTVMPMNVEQSDVDIRRTGIAYHVTAGRDELSVGHIATVKYNTNTYAMDIEYKTVPDQHNLAMGEIAKSVEQVKTWYREFKDYYDAQAIHRFYRAMLDDSDAIRIGDKSVYFILNPEFEALDRMLNMLVWMNKESYRGECSIATLEIGDTEGNRDYIIMNYEETVFPKLDRLIEELSEKIRLGEPITDKKHRMVEAELMDRKQKAKTCFNTIQRESDGLIGRFKELDNLLNQVDIKGDEN